jgi:NAD(P)-dependent dehydrogenase (short-subunit alcohol dehydrogenase family)
MTNAFRTAWVIGASSGIGRELTKILVGDGVTVTASARRAEALNVLKNECPPDKIRPLPLDVSDPDAVVRAANVLEREHGLPDVVVIAAALYEPAAADDLNPSLFAKFMAVNYLGVVNVFSALLPKFLTLGRGHIAVVASVAGYRGLPLASAYGPTKAAIINLCESLVPELSARGVRLQVINPGFVDTPLTAKNTFAMPFMISPQEAARRLYRGLQSGRFEVTFPKRFTWLLKVLRILPYALYFPLIGAMTRVKSRRA